MSNWTHITACLSVETDIEDKNILSIVKDYIDKAPKITGSEGDAAVFINQTDRHNIWYSADCKNCEYGNTIIHHSKEEGGGYSCDADIDYKCPNGTYNTCVVISIQGDLRDREENETREEFEKFKEYIEKEYEIRDFAVNIVSDGGF